MRIPVKGLLRAGVSAAAGAGLVYAAMAVPGTAAVGPAPERDGPRAGGTSTVRSSALVCPGPELRGVQGVDDLDVDVTVAAAVAPERALTGVELPAASGSFAISGMPPGAPGVKAAGRGVVTSLVVPTGHAVAVLGQEALAPGLAAAQSWLVASGDQRGLGTAACGPASAESWLVAGGGAPGRQERLVLTNPGDNSVSVDVTVHGTKGPVDSATGRGILVPPRGRTSVLLDAIAPTEVSPVVRVVASGGTVHAVLNDLWMDGSTPAGSDDALAAAAPSRDQVIPGVTVKGAAVLRVAVPGDAEAVVQARALTKDGPRALPGDGVVRVAGGAVRDISLSQLPEGVYGIQVRADVPVVAGALVVRRAAGAPGDLAWAASSTPVSAVAGAPLVPLRVGAVAGTRGLALVSTGGASSVEVVTTDADGRATSQRLTVAADTATTLGLGAAGTVWVHRLSGDGELRAAVVSAVGAPGGELLSVMPLADAALRTTGVGLLERSP